MTLFLGNMWTELVSEPGLLGLDRIFGGVTHGNWLKGERLRQFPDADVTHFIHAPSTSDSDVAASLQNHKGFFWCLYPDELFGWDFKRNDYVFKLLPAFENVRNYGLPIVFNSKSCQVTAIRSGAHSGPILNLPINYNAIDLCPQSARSRVTLCWPHRWRTHKNIRAALNATKVLAPQFPAVDFLFSRSESWDGSDADITDMKTQWDSNNGDLGDIRSMPNVIFENKDLDQAKYWQLLKSCTAVWSTSTEESFGVAMLEAAAAATTCIVPKHATYQETIPSAYCYGDEDGLVVGLIDFLNSGKQTWDQVGERCRVDSTKYGLETWLTQVESLMARVC